MECRLKRVVAYWLGDKLPVESGSREQRRPREVLAAAAKGPREEPITAMTESPKLPYHLRGASRSLCCTTPGPMCSLNVPPPARPHHCSAS